MTFRIASILLALSCCLAWPHERAAAVTIVGGSATITLNEGLANSLGEFDAYFDGVTERAETLSEPAPGNAAFTESPTNPGMVTVIDPVRPAGEIPVPYPGTPGETRSRQITSLDFEPADLLGTWDASDDGFAFIGKVQLGEQIAFTSMQRWTGNFTGVLLYGDFALRRVNNGAASKLFLTSNIDFPHAAFAEIGDPVIAVTDEVLTISGNLLMGGGLFILDPSATPGTEFGTFVLTALLASPGDFDRDGDVDGGDFLVWQRGESPSPLSPTDLADWKTHFGADAVSASQATPEPSTTALLCAAVTGATAFRRRSRRSD